MATTQSGRHDGEAAIAKAKHEAYLKFDAKLKKWRGLVQPNNLKVLLCSLHDVLWEDANWKRIGMHEFMEGDQKPKLKKLFRKAILITHPDRNNTKSEDQKFLANNIFATLNEEWEKYENTGVC